MKASTQPAFEVSHLQGKARLFEVHM